MSYCRVTEEYVKIATPAHHKLEKACGCEIAYAWGLANFYGKGTMQLCIVPPVMIIYDQHREEFDEFYNTLREAGFLKTEPEEKTDLFGSGMRREVRKCLSCIIQNLEYKE